MPRLCLTALAAVVAGLLAAGPAAAHHQGTASATASLSLDPPRPGCKMVERRTRTHCDGSRVVRVTWSVGCGARPFVTVHHWSPRPGGGAPIKLESVELYDEQSSGVTATRFEAGVKVFATVEVDCFFEDPNGTIPEHSATATSAPTAEAYIPPRLNSVEAVSNSFCGLDVPIRWLDTVLQAGQTSNGDFHMTFDDSSLLGVGRFSRAARRRTVLFARGAGLRVKARARPWVPGATERIRTEAGIRWTPRKAGTLRVWAEIGGHRTNVLAFRVVKARCR
jgi:hypothetical protein